VVAVERSVAHPDYCSPIKQASGRVQILDRRSLALSHNLERPAAAVRTIAFVLPRPRVARSR